MSDINKYFYETYEECRAEFKNSLPCIQSLWENAAADSFDIVTKEDELTIDVINAPAQELFENLLIITTGEHGIEGYLGSVILKLFTVEFLNRLNPENTGLLFVHGINPYGMKYRRKSNENNVDINRNFVIDWDKLNKQINENYKSTVSFFQPESQYRSSISEGLKFTAGLLKSIKKIGISSIERALTLGQYEFDKGLYYGGTTYEPSTKYMRKLYETVPIPYKNVVHLDIHTGYGPVNNMSIVNSRFEKRSSEELKKTFSYPEVLKTDANEFYEINGDMIDYIYRLFESKFPGKHLYSTTLEFGTIGDGILDSLKTLGIAINENRLHFYGAKSDKASEKIKDDFDLLYAPRDKAWCENAADKFRQAAEGILIGENFIGK